MSFCFVDSVRSIIGVKPDIVSDRCTVTFAGSRLEQMKDRASRYAPAKFEKKTGGAVLVAYVIRTPKGKIRLKRIGIRLQGQKEQPVCEAPTSRPQVCF